MRRRLFCRYFINISFSFAGVASIKHLEKIKTSCKIAKVMIENFMNDPAIAVAPKSSLSKYHHRWVVLYWMPYDNNLVSFGEKIIKMLRYATIDSENVVVVQSDYFGDRKMRRRQLLNGVEYEIDIVGEDSSDVSTFFEYLNWANKTFEAEHWAVIVLGHGGKINQVSPDENGGIKTVSWMGVDQFAKAVSEFNYATNGRVDILFFQNCNKATLEVIYEVRNCARYTLASQLALGAPNYYYEGFLNRIKDRSIGGYEGAIAIMESERGDMYNTLTLLDNKFVKLIPEKLSRLIQAILSKELPEINQSELSAYHYFNEQHCDLLVFLEYLSKNNREAQKEFTKFAEFIRSSVIANYQTGGLLFGRRFIGNTKAKNLCGLSLYLPEREQDISRYILMNLSQEVDLLSLYKRMFGG